MASPPVFQAEVSLHIHMLPEATSCHVQAPTCVLIHFPPFPYVSTLSAHPSISRKHSGHRHKRQVDWCCSITSHVMISHDISMTFEGCWNVDGKHMKTWQLRWCCQYVSTIFWATQIGAMIKHFSIPSAQLGCFQHGLFLRYTSSCHGYSDPVFSSKRYPVSLFFAFQVWSMNPFGA